MYGSRDPNLLMPIFYKIPIKISACFLVEIDKLILKVIWKCTGPQIAKTTLKKKNKAGGLTLFYFKTSYKTTLCGIGINTGK